MEKLCAYRRLKCPQHKCIAYHFACLYFDVEATNNRAAAPP
jgi:hypothetical protein